MKSDDERKYQIIQEELQIKEKELARSKKLNM